jgi:hypothetical protein
MVVLSGNYNKGDIAQFEIVQLKPVMFVIKRQ